MKEKRSSTPQTVTLTRLQAAHASDANCPSAAGAMCQRSCLISLRSGLMHRRCTRATVALTQRGAQGSAHKDRAEVIVLTGSAACQICSQGQGHCLSLQRADALEMKVNISLKVK